MSHSDREIPEDPAPTPRNPDDAPSSGDSGETTLSWSSDEPTPAAPVAGAAGPQPAAPSARRGDTIGNYRLERQLGRGGFAEVWEASHRETGRRVALKLMRRPLEGEERLRFEREARLAASLGHPGCVFVYGTESWEGGLAVAMEIVPGGTLQDLVEERGALPFREAVDAVLDIASGLEAAAEKGILHRDVKPSNCFLTEEGRVKIGDFGLSKSVEGSEGLTMTGTFLGTPAYSSPEQVRGRPLDHRSDIFSLGATLYHLLTGVGPWGRGRPGEILARIVSEDPPPPSDHGVTVPRGLVRVLRRMMAREPQKRFGTYEELREALVPYASRGLTTGRLARRFGAWILDDILLGITVALVLGRGGPGIWIGTAHLGLTVFGKNAPALVSIFGDHAVFLMDLALTIAYFIVLEARWGGSLGKRAVGLRVRAADGGDPGLRRVVLRTLTWALLLFVPTYLISAAGASTVSVVALALGAALLFVPMRSANAYAGLHEIVSGTRVVRRPGPIARRLEISPAPVGSSDPSVQYGPFLGGETLWQVDGVRLIEGRDPVLERRIWILEGPEPPRTSETPGTLRQLEGNERDGGPWTAWEAPEGRPFLEWAEERGGATWEESRLIASGLCEALAGRSDPLDAGRLWVEPSGQVRILPFPWRGRRDEPLPPEELVHRVLALALEGGATRTGLERAARPRRPIPGSARELFARYRDDPHPSLSEVAETLESLADRPSQVSRRSRLATLGFQSPFLLLLFVTALIISLHAIQNEPGAERLELAERLDQLRSLEAGDQTTPERRKAIEDLLVQGYLESTLPRDQLSRRSELVSGEEGISGDLGNRGGLAIRNLLEGRPPDASSPERPLGLPYPLPSEDVEWLEELSRGRELRTDADLAHIRNKAPRTRTTLSLHLAGAALYLAVLGVLPGLLAFALRGGLSLGLAEIEVQQLDGRLASRWRCALRALLPYLLLALPFLALLLSSPDHPLVLALLAGVFLVLCVGFVWTLARPARGLQDIVARTILLPR